MLDDLDRIAWNRLSHAYGDADDTPDLLRTLATGTGDEAGEALGELFGSIFHQGTVYPATVAAVPFLAWLAGHAPHHRDEVTWLVGSLADPRHAYGESCPAVRAAVARQLPALVALLDDAEPAVREAAAYAVATAVAESTMDGAGPEVTSTVERLRGRWAVEPEPAVRASLALALGRLADGAAGPVLRAATVDGPPDVRVAAAVALVRAGVDWPDRAVPAVVGAVDEGATLAYHWARGGDWSEELVVAPPLPVAVEMLTAMLTSAVADTRRAGIWSAGARGVVSRSAPPVLVPMTVPALDDPDPAVRREAVGALRRAGRVAGRFTGALTRIAARFPDLAGQAASTAEVDAVLTLMRLGDPGWLDPVCAAAAAGHRVASRVGGVRFTPDLLAAVSDRLTAEPARADVLADVLGAWGADAAPAVPALLAALSHAPAPTAARAFRWSTKPPATGTRIAAALVAIGHDEPAAVPHLRALVAESDDLHAAAAVRRLTGDPAPSVAALTALLTGGQPVPYKWIADLTVDLGTEVWEAVHPVALPLVSGAAAPTFPDRQRQILAAHVVARARPDAAPGVVLPTVRAVLNGGGTPARTAADLLADLTATYPFAVASVDLDLWRRLGDEWSRMAAARVLARLGVPTADLADVLVEGVTDYSGRYGVDIIVELRAVETVPALETLLRRDERLGVSAIDDDLVWADEQLCDDLERAVTDLRSVAGVGEGLVDQ